MHYKKIAWEKWEDNIIYEETVDSIYELNSDEDDEENELVEEALLFLSKIPKLISTPTGIAQMHDKMSLLNQFECWMGYTNFDITPTVAKILEKTDGVELLQVTGRYRFFIGIGKLFNFREVRSEVEKQLCDSRIKQGLQKLNLDEYTEDTIELIKESIDTDKHWDIFVKTNGEVKYASTNLDDDEFYLNQLLNYEKDKELSGGLIFQNED